MKFEVGKIENRNKIQYTFCFNAYSFFVEEGRGEGWGLIKN